MRAGVLKSPHAGMFQFSGNAPDTATALNTLYREQERRKRVLGWRRTHKDPFAGEWEQITAWLVAFADPHSSARHAQDPSLRVANV